MKALAKALPGRGTPAVALPLLGTVAAPACLALGRRIGFLPCERSNWQHPLAIVTALVRSPPPFWIPAGVPQPGRLLASAFHPSAVMPSSSLECSAHVRFATLTGS